jgi:magnesium-transporting ATPase (P-type)
MFLGTYTTLFESSVSPWTTLAPLAGVISISLCQEAASDWKRHRSDHKTNQAQCIVLRRADEIEGGGKERDKTILGGEDVAVKIVKQLEHNRTPLRSSSGMNIGGKSESRKSLGRPPTAASSITTTSAQQPGHFVDIAFHTVKRMNIRAGDIVLVKNREMIPADIILLGSSGENGAAYVETSPIDGETNLKLRKSPHLPLSSMPMSTPKLGIEEAENYVHPKFESIERAVKRLTRMSLLGHPNAKSSLLNPNNVGSMSTLDTPPPPKRTRSSIGHHKRESSIPNVQIDDDAYVATLTSELPNASVNTFSGKITLPPTNFSEPSIDIPLDAENILLRGAMLRNTEWVLGVACFTGDDTKLARNSIKTPSKFSRLDELMNRTVILILFIMFCCVLLMSLMGYTQHLAGFESLWYAGFAPEGTPWPYMKINGKAVYPKFRTEPPGFHQFVFTYITLLNNFVPLSLYVTVEMITLFMMFLIGWDRRMYHEETDTPAVARSTIVTDLGQVKYVFSDKTGTLTQNVMRFKRCSVDGSIFGAPVVKANPNGDDDDDDQDYDEEMLRSKFHDLKQLLVGSISLKMNDDDAGGDSDEIAKPIGKTLTFNAEMFLRVMSICHTVVVEKEIDASNINNKQRFAEKGAKDSIFKWGGNRSRNNTAEEPSFLGSIIETKSSDYENDKSLNANDSQSIGTFNDKSVLSTVSEKLGKSDDGSPFGFAYQAESPDEGALVSAASLEYGFQLISRDSDGVKLCCTSPSLLSIDDVASRLKKGTLTPKELAAETACPHIGVAPNYLKNAYEKLIEGDATTTVVGKEEVWPILAINKFDSTRKRMSVLVRSPPELGSIPMLLIKGADSSMLDPEVCEGGQYITSGALGGEKMNKLIQSDNICADDSEEWEKSVLLNMQSQLGIFASEGLRTLVLGVRILTERECDVWLAKYNTAATAIQNRDAKLTAVAQEIETKIHIVGSTAIEDKLQDGVPETIYNIARAGIKLWVLTGDKRETAIEIGYSTKVLHPKMHLTDVADGNAARVKALVAMEFIRLVKIGKLAAYQKNAEQKKSKIEKYFAPIIFFFRCIGKILRMISRTYRRFYFTFIITLCGLIRRDYAKRQLEKIQDEVDKEGQKDKGRHKEVRDLAETILKEYRLTDNYAKESGRKPLKTAKNFSSKDGVEDEDEHLPEVFHRASNANTVLDIQHGHLNSASIRGLSLMALGSDENVAPNVDSQPVIDDDVMSLASALPGKSQGQVQIFNKKKRTLLEKLFAVDRDVRKGKLVRHLTKEKREEYFSSYKIMNQTSMADVPDGINTSIDRALVIEGSALAHFLGNPLLEELLFAVASSCESVIACRVSPKQKALLVKLVKQFVTPSPVTLAIGDGANDVGMIQEAQVGVGISGLEGQQAVNSSDFAIAQFRFLEDLLLVHGRWNFMRLSKTVLFSFYKNAILAGLLIVFSKDAYYSGEPLFDMWALSSFNFVNGFGILLYGMFDRDVDKDYVKENPILYAAGPSNEHMALRVTFRWVILVFVHVNLIYFIADLCLSGGSTQSAAFKGQMRNALYPGDGDGSDLKVFGTAIFVALNWVLALKVLYESGSIIHGRWPALLGCCKNAKEGFWSRVAYTWHGIIFLCVGFNFFFIYLYQVRLLLSCSLFDS